MITIEEIEITNRIERKSENLLRRNVSKEILKLVGALKGLVQKSLLGDNILLAVDLAANL